MGRRPAGLRRRFGLRPPMRAGDPGPPARPDRRPGAEDPPGGVRMTGGVPSAYVPSMSRPALYSEFPPGPRLDDLVECYWCYRGSTGDDPGGHRVVPDGCTDLVFHLDPAPASGPGAASRAHVAGPMPRAVVIPRDEVVHTWGVRFRPGGAPAFLGVPADELTGESPDLALLWGDASRTVLDRLDGAAGWEERSGLLDRLLTRRMNRRQVDEVAIAARRALSATGGNTPIGELAARLGLSRRHLHRRVTGAVGLSPKLLARILRFRRAVMALHGDPDLEKGRLALRLGYCDQAHFGRDFRELAGVSPGGYLEERGRVRFVQADAADRGQIGLEEARDP